MFEPLDIRRSRLLDWYVQLRGMDEWPETLATVQSMDFVEGGYGADGKLPDAQKVGFTYHDAAGNSRSGKVNAYEDADLFFIEVGSNFPIRYNPKRTENYFVRGAQGDSSSFTTLILLGFLTAGLIELIRICVTKFK